MQTFVIPNMGALALSFTLAMVDVLPTRVVIAISKGKIVREGGLAVQNFIAPRFLLMKSDEHGLARDKKEVVVVVYVNALFSNDLTFTE